MTAWRCYYHVIWATKNRLPTINPEYEKIIFAVVRSKSRELGCHVHAVNGMADHIHVAVSVPPSVAVARWVKNVKGTTSYEVNTLFPNAPERFQWQGGYSVLTFGAKQLDFVTDYIMHQKQHHAANAVYTDLEGTDDD